MNPKSSLTAGTVILDEVLESIAKALTTRAPECGGLLYGPRGQKLITHFEADEQAEHHYTTYTPSAAICKRGPEIEREHGLEYKGVIHSHPGSMDHPSGPDIENARKALSTNLHMTYFMMPIVTLGNFEPSDLASHELLLPGGKLSHWMVPQAAPKQGRQLFKERISSLTLWGDLRSLAAGLPNHPEVGRSSMLDIEGVSAAAYLLDTGDGTWMFAAAAGYPFTPPLVVPPTGKSSSAPLAWDLSVSAERRFQAAVAPLLDLHGRLPTTQVDVAEPCVGPVSLRPKKWLVKFSRRTKDRLVLCSVIALSSAVGSLVAGLALRSISNRTNGSTNISQPLVTTENPAGVGAETVNEQFHETPQETALLIQAQGIESSALLELYNSTPPIGENPMSGEPSSPSIQDFGFDLPATRGGAMWNPEKSSPFTGNSNRGTPW